MTAAGPARPAGLRRRHPRR